MRQITLSSDITTAKWNGSSLDKIMYNSTKVWPKASAAELEARILAVDPVLIIHDSNNKYTTSTLHVADRLNHVLSLANISNEYGGLVVQVKQRLSDDNSKFTVELTIANSDRYSITSDTLRVYDVEEMLANVTTEWIYYIEEL